MRYLDDILFILGCICFAAAAFGIDWRLGLFATGICLEVSAVLLAKWEGDGR